MAAGTKTAAVIETAETATMTGTAVVTRMGVMIETAALKRTAAVTWIAELIETAAVTKRAALVGDSGSNGGSSGINDTDQKRRRGRDNCSGESDDGFEVVDEKEKWGVVDWIFEMEGLELKQGRVPD
ncbi:hypothetical protein MMC29_001269 [Sticta canariensis]|nr:hypothetical protein [Sticta canariensis]